MGGTGGPDKLIVNGKRLDSRKLDELRPLTIKAGTIPNAEGSCELQMGETKVIAAVYGPKEVLPRHLEESDRAYLSAYYDMAAFSTTDRCRPGPDRRSKEIAKVMRDALAASIILEKYPRTSIAVYVEVINANAGTRCAAITAAAVALADAGIEMRDMPIGVAGGKADDTVILDLDNQEDNFGQADVPLAILPRTKEISLLQMDGHLTKDEIKTIFSMCSKASDNIQKAQKEALLAKYGREKNE